MSTFGAKGYCKGIQILKSESPLGPFVLMTNKPITPIDWNCIDGTLFFDENNIPWLAYSHSVPEEPRGAVCASPLDSDLKEVTAPPITLFYASDAKWAKPIPFAKSEFGLDGEVYFSDGIYFFKDSNNKLYTLLSSWGNGGYSIGVVESESGTINGLWFHHKKALYADNGGHGMLFRRKNDNALLLALHYPNDKGKERPCFLELDDSMELSIKS